MRERVLTGKTSYSIIFSAYFYTARLFSAPSTLHIDDLDLARWPTQTEECVRTWT